MKLTAVVPVGGTDFGEYELALRIRAASASADIETLIVADACSDDLIAKLDRFCSEHRFRFIQTNSEDQEFSLSRARNAGMTAAGTKWVIQEDADIVHESTFYKKILREIEMQAETPFTFFTVPTIYLTERASNNIRESESVDPHVDLLLTKLALEDIRGGRSNASIQSYAPASAVLVLPRSMGLELGGYDTGFTGWGGEDRDFAFRLLLNTRTLPWPDQFHYTAPWSLNDTVAFEGWRSLFRLIGDYFAHKGIYCYHLFHQPRFWKDEGVPANFERAAEKAHRHYFSNSHTPPHEQPKLDLKRSLLFDRYCHHDLVKKSGLMQLSETSLRYKPRKWRTAESRIAEKTSFKLACTAYHDGEFERAAASFLEAYRLAPTSIKYLRAAAESYFNCGRRDLAISALRNAKTQSSSNRIVSARLSSMKHPHLLWFLSPSSRYVVPLPTSFSDTGSAKASCAEGIRTGTKPR